MKPFQTNAPAVEWDFRTDADKARERRTMLANARKIAAPVSWLDRVKAWLNESI